MSTSCLSERVRCCGQLPHRDPSAKPLRAWLGVYVLALGLHVGSLFGQNIGPLQSTTQLVQVTVRGVSRDGRPVTTLNREDFEICEQGIPRRVSVFDFDPRAPEPSAPAPLESRTLSNEEATYKGPVATVVFLDKVGTRTSAWVRAWQSVKLALAGLDPKNTAVYLLDPATGFQVVHEFGSPDFNFTQEGEIAIAAPSTESADSGFTRPTFAKRQDTLPVPVLFSSGRTYSRADALQIIEERLSGMRGRKSLVWFAGEFPESSLHLIGQVPGALNGQLLQKILVSMIAANICFYPVDARGLTTDAAFDAGNQNIGIGPVAPGELTPLSIPQDFSSEMDLAKRSGGEAFFNTNGLSQALGEISILEKSTYTLGFYTDQKPDNKYHRLVVKTRREGVTLHYRPGYWALSTPAKDNEVSRNLERTLLMPFMDGGVKLRAVPAFASTGPRVLTLTLYIRLADLVSAPYQGRPARIVDIVFGQKDGRGRIFAIPPYRISMPVEKSDSQWFATRVKLVVRPTSRTLRLAVRDSRSGVTGSLDAPLAAMH